MSQLRAQTSVLVSCTPPVFFRTSDVRFAGMGRAGGESKFELGAGSFGAGSQADGRPGSVGTAHCMCRDRCCSSRSARAAWSAVFSFSRSARWMASSARFCMTDAWSATPRASRSRPSSIDAGNERDGERHPHKSGVYLPDVFKGPTAVSGRAPNALSRALRCIRKESRIISSSKRSSWRMDCSLRSTARSDSSAARSCVAEASSADMRASRVLRSFSAARAWARSTTMDTASSSAALRCSSRTAI
ncbi:hypothetical protein B0H15DRAFT_840918, partial [Mycena belliarum]